MVSLLVIIFVVEVTVAVVNTIGVTTLNNLVCAPECYLYVPSRDSSHGTSLTSKNTRSEVKNYCCWLTHGAFLQLWNLYTSAPVGTSKQIREQRELQQSYLKVRRDLNATSSQDEFAKWAKLRRQHDKLLEELEKKSMSFERPSRNTNKHGLSIGAFLCFRRDCRRSRNYCDNS